MRWIYVALMSIIFLVTGCSSVSLSAVEQKDFPPAVSAQPVGAPVVDMSSSRDVSSDAPEGGVAQVSVGGQLDVQDEHLMRVMYFEFDSYVVDTGYQSKLMEYVKYMREHPGAKLVLAGHTDKLGGRSYNIALGQKRAEAVEQILKLLGVTEDALEPISYGEEHPAQEGDEEQDLAKNRRVEFLVQ